MSGEIRVAYFPMLKTCIAEIFRVTCTNFMCSYENWSKSQPKIYFLI